MRKDHSIVSESETENFEEIYARYHRKMLSYFTPKMDNVQDAEDLVEEVFLYCYRHFDEFDPAKASISTWLYVIATSKWKNYCRDKHITQDIDQWDFGEDASSYGIEQAVWLEQMINQLTIALEKLTDQQRKIVILKYYDGKSAGEIAKILGSNSNNIRVQLNKALKLMRKYMEPFKE